MLTTTEIAQLVIDVQALVAQVEEARSRESEGGTRVTRDERRRLVRAALSLALRAALAVID